MATELNTIAATVGKILLGKELQVKLAMACLIGRGHLLIEDLPGMGKTTLAHALAQVLGLAYQRVQFTSDMLPADVLGINMFDPGKGSFEFHPGPIFTQVLLADEINRTTPKTQSALLEAMEEEQVSIEGTTRQLPHPFFVIATQNPATQTGTYPLPESQLDRFLMCLTLGYPDQRSERMLYEGLDPRAELQKLQPVSSPEALLRYQTEAQQVMMSDTVLRYVERLVHYTRNSDDFSVGLSPRGALSLVRAARAWAYLDGRQHVIPEDIQAVFSSVVLHRLRDGARFTGKRDDNVAQRILDAVDVIG